MAETPNPPDERPSKLVAFQAFLREGWVSIHLDARRPGVSVPPEFADSPHLVLQYGLNMPIPIPDLKVTDEGVSATLSFSRQPHQTVIPWSAIYIVACEDGRGVLYQEDVPSEVSLVARPVEPREASAPGEPGAADPPSAEGPPPEKENRPVLRSVPLDVDTGAEEEADPLGKTGKRRRRPTLKLVK
jgi:stringent starvation protein B